MTKRCIACLILAFPLYLLSQKSSPYGLPEITNYSPQDYGADGVNWWIVEDDRGFLYFANNNGILEFDGANWRLITPAERPETRSLVKGADGKIYVGTNGDIGYLKPDSRGKLEFFSIRNKLPEQNQIFNEVWESFLYRDKVAFRTNNDMFLWDGQAFEVIHQDGLHVGKVIGDTLYQRIWNIGLTYFDQGVFKLLPGGEQFASERIYSILPYEGHKLLIGVRNEGFYVFDGQKFMPWQTDAYKIIIDNIYLPGCKVNDNLFVFNSFSNGLALTDHQGKLIYHLDKTNGLRDNSVDYTYMDKQGNLWAALFNGISKISISDPINYFTSREGLPSSTVFNTVRHEGIIYCGTQDGVYFLDNSNNQFKYLPRTSGQSYLFKIGSRLLIASGDNGLQEVKNGQLVILRPDRNYDFRLNWIYRSNRDSSRYFLILQEGIVASVILGPDNYFREESRTKKFLGSAGNFIERRDGKIWAFAGKKGEVLLVNPALENGTMQLDNSQITTYTSKDGLPDKNISFLNYNDSVFFNTFNPIEWFIFDEQEQKFKKHHPDFESFTANTNTAISPPVTDEYGRIWMNYGTGVFVRSEDKDGKISYSNAPFRRLSKFPVWDIFHEKDEKNQLVTWLSGPDGLVSYRGTLQHGNVLEYQVMLRSIHIKGDSLLWFGSDVPPNELQVANHLNTITFNYSSPFYIEEKNLEYATKLDGLDNTWSSWSKNNAREYINLPARKYTFQVKARNIYGLESALTSYSFSVLPHWTATWWAYSLYLMVSLGVFYTLVRWRTRNFRRRSEQLEVKIQERTVELKQKVEELATVNEVSRALSTQLESKDLIKLVGDQMRTLFKADIVYLALLEPKENMIYFPYQYGDNMPPMPLGQGLTSQIILNGMPQLINQDVSSKYSELGIEEIGKQAASYLGVPIESGKQIIGVLSVQSTQIKNRFNNDDLHLLSTIASYVGIAIHNAQLFDEVKQAQIIAEDANEAKSSFLSTVSHELRTPLTSVLGFAKIIKKRLEEKVFPALPADDAKLDKVVQQITENLNVVVSEGERLTGLVNDVLDLAKIEAGKVEWNMQQISLRSVIERAISATMALFDQKKLTLTSDLQPVPEVIGDNDKLIQVVINLLSNAVKFTEQGTVECKLFAEGDEVIVAIKDTGIGIAPEDQGKVFEKFRQVGDTLTDKPKGTGLGLPICKEIVEHHEGRMWLESKIGHGSTFYFSIPQTPNVASVDSLKLDELVQKLKKISFGFAEAEETHRTILVVDDETPIRSLLRQELSETGYTVIEAATGMEALEQVRINKPDLILLDVMMPEMNGFDVAAVLKNDPKTMDIPIIILSIVQDKERGFKIGVDRYLTKPIDTDKLQGEIERLLGQGKSHKKVMVIDEDASTVRTLMDVLNKRGYEVVEANGPDLLQKAMAEKPDIIMLNSVLQSQQDKIKALRFQKGMENVLFLLYQ